MEELEGILICIVVGWIAILLHLAFLTIEGKVNYPNKVFILLMIAAFPLLGSIFVAFASRIMIKDNYEF